MALPARLMMIGLDSADRDLIGRWAGEGLLPNLAKLLEDGVVGQVENPLGMESGTVWPTFHTGVMPGRHQQYDANRIFDSELYDHRVLRPDEMSPHYMWNHFNAHGKRLCLIDPIYTQMPKVDNGVVVFDWATHIPGGGGMVLDFATSPPELAAEIEQRFGPDPLGGKMCDTHQPRTAEELIWFRDALVARTKQKADLAAWLLEEGRNKEPWDFFYVALCEAHCAGHHGWHLHDPTHPDHDPAILEAVGDLLRIVYQALDTAVGRIVEAAGPDMPIILFCSHGIGAEYTGTRMLNRLLVALEGRRPTDMRSPHLNAARKVWRALPEGLRDTLKPMQRRAWRKMMADGFQPGREKRRYFEVYLNNRTAGVRINLKGREANGQVAPGAEYEALMEQITRDLLTFTNAETGEPLVDSCVPLSKEIAGAHAGNLPDLAVTWNTNAPIRRVTSPKTGEIVNEELTVRSGDHRPIGQFIARVPGRPARRLNEPVRTVDFVPTFFALLGIPLPDSDGTPIGALVD